MGAAACPRPSCLPSLARERAPSSWGRRGASPAEPPALCQVSTEEEGAGLMGWGLGGPPAPLSTGPLPRHTARKPKGGAREAKLQPASGGLCTCVSRHLGLEGLIKGKRIIVHKESSEDLSRFKLDLFV